MSELNADEPTTAAADGGLVRVRLDLAYDGTDFSGWARQPGRRTVEQTLVDALAMVLRLDGVRLVVAGRTDAGVHATGQVAHCDLPTDTDVEALSRRLGGVLPEDVVVHRVAVAPAGFDARFAAAGRHYRYRVADRMPNPLRRRDTLGWAKPLDVESMSAAGRQLEGEHDFAAYCRPRQGATTVRTLHQLVATRDDAGVVAIHASADAFCHNQVRAMVGALLAVGDGRRAVDWPRCVLEGRTRDPAVTVAPPHGLTLVQVDYPPPEAMAARAVQARARRN